MSKSHSLPFNISSSYATCPLELVHSNLWNSPLVFVKGHGYHIHFIDEFSKFT